jgi:hypothetical protein
MQFGVQTALQDTIADDPVPMGRRTEAAASADQVIERPTHRDTGDDLLFLSLRAPFDRDEPGRIAVEVTTAVS